MTASKVLIIYHQYSADIDCPDGIASAWVVARKFPDFELLGDAYLNNEDYLKETYQLPFDPTNRDIVIVDFSYPKHILEFIADYAKSLIVLDHHKSRMNDLESLSDRILGGYNPDECGATFAWKFFFPYQEMPWFLHHVRNRDIGANGYYEGEIPESEAINTVISEMRRGLRGTDVFSLVFDRLMVGMFFSEDELIARGLLAIKERDLLVEEALNQYNGALIDVAGFLVPYYQIANPEARKHYSIIGSKAAIRHLQDPHYPAPFVAIVTDDPMKIELRAAKDSPVDLSQIAKSLGGGGQPRAAGYRIGAAGEIAKPYKWVKRYMPLPVLGDHQEEWGRI